MAEVTYGGEVAYYPSDAKDKLNDALLSLKESVERLQDKLQFVLRPAYPTKISDTEVDDVPDRSPYEDYYYQKIKEVEELRYRIDYLVNRVSL